MADTAKLGFGLMRLPHIDDDMSKPIDLDQVKQMVDVFMQSGNVYFDTAYVYEGSEDAAREALVKRYPRESFVLATKMPGMGVESPQKMDQIFDEQLQRTQAGYFDYYLLHGIDPTNADSFEQPFVWQWLAQKKAQGLIKHIAFSFHDHADVLEKILERHPEVEMVQIQANYADWDNPVVESRRCYEAIRRHGAQVVVMEPLLGGKLVNLPQSVADVLLGHNPQAPLASWGLRFFKDLDGIVAVLSGMSSVQQVADNVAIMDGRFGQRFDDAERAVLARAQQAIDRLPQVRCTDCRYCMPGCPVGIYIPKVLDAYNEYLTYGDIGSAKFSYGFTLKNSAKASECVQCGACEAVCTQHIGIIEELAKATELLED